MEILGVICKHTRFVTVSNSLENEERRGEETVPTPQAFIAAHLARQRA